MEGVKHIASMGFVISIIVPSVKIIVHAKYAYKVINYIKEFVYAHSKIVKHAKVIKYVPNAHILCLHHYYPMLDAIQHIIQQLSVMLLTAFSVQQ